MAQMQEVRGVQTSIRTDETGTHINYRGTDVVSFSAGSITLRTGGWRSNTTKLRMNQAANQYRLGFSVFQKNHEWFVQVGDAEPVPFEGDTLILAR